MHRHLSTKPQKLYELAYVFFGRTAEQLLIKAASTGSESTSTITQNQWIATVTLINLESQTRAAQQDFFLESAAMVCINSALPATLANRECAREVPRPFPTDEHGDDSMTMHGRNQPSSAHRISTTSKNCC